LSYPLREFCDRCELRSEGELLRELAQLAGRSLRDIARRSQQRPDSPLGQALRKIKEAREQEERARLEEYENLLQQYEENLSFEIMDKLLEGSSVEELAGRILQDEFRKELQDKIRSLRWRSPGVGEGDVKEILQEYEQEGYIEIEDGKIRITSKGARRLAAGILERILRHLTGRDVGSHPVEKAGFGAELSLYTRNYEFGDDYSLVDVEKTALNALERCGKLRLELADFEVHEEVHQTKLCAGIIIDESGSMRNGYKLEAAIETALALSELIRREPKDKLLVYTFSERARQISPWAIVNEVMSGGATDIRSALRTFREAVTGEKGSRQAYLITDAEPNMENGAYVGFEQAALGLLEEAWLYRQQNIGLNIIMLDETPRLRQLASSLARRNLGRVFFTTPFRLGEVVVEDYLKLRKESA